MGPEAATIGAGSTGRANCLAVAAVGSANQLAGAPGPDLASGAGNQLAGTAADAPNAVGGAPARRAIFTLERSG
jgi:hypothetical protein